MKNKRFVAGVFTALAAVALGLAALSVNSCKPKGTEIAVTGISVSQPSISITEGETAVISYSVEPSDASVKDVSFSSSDTGVATVDETGRVTAVAPGTATITITSKDGGFKATVTVTVTAKGTTPPDPPAPGNKSVTGITLSASDITIRVGDVLTLTATVEPDDATDKTIEWKSDKSPVAIVDDDGNVTGMAVGSARIIATSKSNPSVSASCYVIVIDQNSWEYIPNKTLTVDGKSPVTLRSVGAYYDTSCDAYDILFLEDDVKTFGYTAYAPECNYLVIDLAKKFFGEQNLANDLTDYAHEWWLFCICKEFTFRDSKPFGSGRMKLEINESAKTISFAIDGTSSDGHTIKCRYEGSYIQSYNYIYQW